MKLVPARGGKKAAEINVQIQSVEKARNSYLKNSRGAKTERMKRKYMQMGVGFQKYAAGLAIKRDKLISGGKG